MPLNSELFFNIAFSDGLWCWLLILQFLLSFRMFASRFALFSHYLSSTVTFPAFTHLPFHFSRTCTLAHPQTNPCFPDELWQFKFAAEVVAEVTARTLTAEAPTYATIMELDRKVREFPLPESMTSPSNGSGAAGSGEEYVFSFQRCVLDHVRETSTSSRSSHYYRTKFSQQFCYTSTAPFLLKLS